MDPLIKALQQHPELAVFLTLALGYLLGRIKLGSFAIGSVTGVLIAGVLIGQMTITISANVKAVFFLLFLFAIGYKVGPQFFGGLHRLVRHVRCRQNHGLQYRHHGGIDGRRHDRVGRAGHGE